MENAPLNAEDIQDAVAGFGLVLELVDNHAGLEGHSSPPIPLALLPHASNLITVFHLTSMDLKGDDS